MENIVKVCLFIVCLVFLNIFHLIIAFVCLYMTESKWEKPEGLQGASSASEQTQQTGVNICFI